MSKKKREPIAPEQIDRKNENPDYWNKILQSYGLSMKAGIPRTRVGLSGGGSKPVDALQYCGTSKDLESYMLHLNIEVKSATLDNENLKNEE